MSWRRFAGHGADLAKVWTPPLDEHHQTHFGTQREIDTVKIVHKRSDEKIVIRMEGLSRKVRMLHATDAHLVPIDDRDADRREECAEFCRLFEVGEDAFHAEMARAATLDVDLVGLTGDIVCFPSHAAIESAARAINQVKAPVLYTSGNHDWRFPEVARTAEQRELWWPRLDPLHKGEPAFRRSEVGGIQFLVIDNSTYQIGPEQLQFTRMQLANGMPTVLLSHIPLSIATLREPTLEMWKAPILVGDPDWNLESRTKIGAGEDTPSTLEYVRLLTTAENLVAIFCGHVHFTHEDTVNPRTVQYIAAPCFSTQGQLVEFLPL
jgi:3',5'-cyclic AMP phosphodiesterase CpdA